MPNRTHLYDTARNVLPILTLDRERDLPELMMPIGNGDSHSSRVLHLTLLVCSALVVIAFVWAAFAPVSEVASLSGTFQPLAQERQVVHVDGGIVANVLVRDGDRVTAGQPIVVMDGALAAGELQFAQQRFAILRQKGRDVQSASGAGETTKGGEIRASVLDAERAVNSAAVQQQGASIATLQTQLATALRTEAMALDDRDRAQRLFKQDATSKTALNQREAIYSEAVGRVALLRRQIEVTASGLDGALANGRLVRSRQALDLLREGNDATLQQTEAEVLLKRAQERVERLTLKSPVTGRVKLVGVHKGDVIAPASPVLVIVPDDQLMVDAKVLARERQGLRPGLPVRLRVNGYDMPGHGWIDANLDVISPSSFADENGRRFYTLRLSMAKNKENQAILPRLSAGMEVNGDVVTGHKTVLGYILGPVRHGLTSALTER